MLDCLQAHSEGTLVRLQVLPRSSRNQIVGLHGINLKLKLTSPPVEGAANKCCCDYFAKLFKIPKADVELLSGEKSRQKRILLRGQTLSQVDAFLKVLLEHS